MIIIITSFNEVVLQKAKPTQPKGYMSLKMIKDLDVGYSVVKDDNVCCCYHFKCANVDQNGIFILMILSYVDRNYMGTRECLLKNNVIYFNIDI